jgi:hypothetical protein
MLAIGFLGRLLEFLVYVPVLYLWMAFTLAFYEDQRRSNLEALTDEERRHNRFSAGFVCFWSSLILALAIVALECVRGWR